MLTKYIHKADLEEVVADTFARGVGKERTRLTWRYIVRGSVVALRVLLSTLYLRGTFPPLSFFCLLLTRPSAAATVLLPLFPNELSIPPRAIITVILALIALPLSLSSSLASKSIIYSTWTALLAYVVWFASATFAHARGTLASNPEWSETGRLWHGLGTCSGRDARTFI